MASHPAHRGAFDLFISGVAMTRSDAITLARKRWGCPGSDRMGFVILRRKSVVSRYEVGYYYQGLRTVMGRGSSWEEAFSRADRQEEQLREEGLTP